MIVAIGEGLWLFLSNQTLDCYRRACIDKVGKTPEADLDAKKLEQLRERYLGDNEGTIYNDRFREIADLQFAEGVRKKPCREAKVFMMESVYRSAFAELCGHGLAEFATGKKTPPV